MTKKNYSVAIEFSATDEQMEEMASKIVRAAAEIIGEPPICVVIMPAGPIASIFYEYPEGKRPTSGLFAFPELDDNEE
jgi:hypothetical protein